MDTEKIDEKKFKVYKELDNFFTALNKGVEQLASPLISKEEFLYIKAKYKYFENYFSQMKLLTVEQHTNAPICLDYNRDHITSLHLLNIFTNSFFHITYYIADFIQLLEDTWLKIIDNKMDISIEPSVVHNHYKIFQQICAQEKKLLPLYKKWDEFYETSIQIWKNKLD